MMTISDIKRRMEKAGVSDWAVTDYRRLGVNSNSIPRGYVATESGDVQTFPIDGPREVIVSDVSERKLTVYDLRSRRSGESEQKLTSQNDAYVDKVIAELAAKAAAQKNPPYALVDGSLTYPRVPMADPVIMGYSQGELLLVTGRLKEELADEIRMQGLEPSNIEVSAEKESRLLRTSRGVDVSEIGTKVFVEFTLLARDGNKVANYTVSTSARRLADIVPSELARKYGRYAWHSLGAQKPKAYTGRVVVMEDALKEMLATDSPFGGNPFDNHASGPLMFRGISILEIGKRICRERIEKRGVTILREKEIRGEPITLINDPLKPYGTMSKSFGIDGTPATRTVIIDKSVLQNVYTDKRHYDWLRLAKKGVACAGPKGNVAILPGKKSVRELLDGDEVVTVRAFSWYNPDPYSADFSSEIRLGSVIRNGVEYPIKGGLLVGNFFDMFTDIELSNETFEAGNYSGPVAMSVSNLKISG